MELPTSPLQSNFFQASSSSILGDRVEESDNAPMEASVKLDFKVRHHASVISSRRHYLVSLVFARKNQLIDWSYMDFSSTFRVDTSVHTIKEVLKKWHGGKVATLAVFKDSYQEMNELRHDHLTLEKCGIRGVSDKENAPTVTLFYDFKPDGCSDPDPLLLC